MEGLPFAKRTCTATYPAFRTCHRLKLLASGLAKHTYGDVQEQYTPGLGQHCEGHLDSSDCYLNTARLEDLLTSSTNALLRGLWGHPEAPNSTISWHSIGYVTVPTPLCLSHDWLPRAAESSQHCDRRQLGKSNACMHISDLSSAF